MVKYLLDARTQNKIEVRGVPRSLCVLGSLLGMAGAARCCRPQRPAACYGRRCAFSDRRVPCMQVLGADYQPRLLELIAPEQLPECYGGTNPTPLR